MTPAYERLPERDAAFLLFETPETHMHLCGVAIFEAGPLAGHDGGVDVDRIRAHITAKLHQIPRYRQRLAWIPLYNHPVWVDDVDFNLAYHVRHTSLPRPGDPEQLKQLAARIASQPLDRDRPLWEVWVVEGLEGGRFALVIKTHHCMADGLSAVDILAVLLSPVAEGTVEPPVPWRPRPAPGAAQLLADETLRRLAAPVAVVRAVRAALDEPERARVAATERLAAIWQMASAGLPPPAVTPLNGRVGPHRRFDGLVLDLADVKAIRSRFGGTVNDVVLTTVAGAIGRFLERRGVAPGGLDYRVVVPVSVREPREESAASNRASGWLLPLPIAERSARRRHARIMETTARLKASKQALAPESLLHVVELAGPLVFGLGVRLTARLAPYNLIVTNVQGPPVPLYLLGAPMMGGFPLAPLFEHQGLAIALFGYCGRLHFGLNADWDLLPDLADFVVDLEESFAELLTRARAADARAAARRVAR